MGELIIQQLFTEIDKNRNNCQSIARSMSFSCKNYFLKSFQRNSISNKSVPLSSWYVMISRGRANISEKLQQGRGAFKRAWFDSQSFSKRENTLTTFYSFLLKNIKFIYKIRACKKGLKQSGQWHCPKE